MINYTFDENSGVVMICASVFEPNIDCPISFSFDISFDISNGTAGIRNLMFYHFILFQNF